MNVILAGGSGAPNYGDELILRNWLSYLADTHPTYSVHIEGTSSKGLKATSSLYSDGYSYSTSLLSVANEKPNLGFFEHVKRGIRFIDHKVYRSHYLTKKISNQITQADVFHLHGGGYMNDMWPHFGFLFGVGVALNKCYGTKFVCTGLGVTPLSVETEDQKNILRTIMYSADVFGVRDPFGVDELTRMTGLSPFQDVDDAFLQKVKTRAYFPDKRVMHVVTYDWVMKINNNLIELIKKEAKGHDQICIWECAPSHDRVAIQMLQGLPMPTELIRVGSLLDDGLPFSNNHSIFTSRFHPALQISRLGGHVITNYNGDYYSDKHRSIECLGSKVGGTNNTLLKKRNLVLSELKRAQAEYIYSTA